MPHHTAGAVRAVQLLSSNALAWLNSVESVLTGQKQHATPASPTSMQLQAAALGSLNQSNAGTATLCTDSCLTIW